MTQLYFICGAKTTPRP